MKKTIEVCMGSACLLKGAPLIAQAFQVALDRLRQTDDVCVTLTGAVCQSQCTSGVVVRINGQTYQHVTVADVPSLIHLCLQED